MNDLSDWRQLTEWDRDHVWHPFTQMAEWCAPGHRPLFIDRGSGAKVYDQDGREYIDGNSSIWTNIHGHRHPHIDGAVRRQLDAIAHSSALGLAGAPAARLARELVSLWPGGILERVFFSDDGSTAIECAMRMAWQCCVHEGRDDRTAFVAFDQAYHGDTLGAASLGGIPAFHERFGRSGFPVRHVAGIADLEAMPAEEGQRPIAVVIEPLIQGAAGMRTWPAGMLRDLRAWCDAHEVFLICDEVMTGFGRTGRMFACEHEGVVPDFVALAKGLTGGYLPLAATLTTRRVFEAFLNGGDRGDRTFYYGHSYTGNALGCAAALASLEVFRNERTLDRLPERIGQMRERLEGLRSRHPQRIGDIRQCGMIAGIDIVADAATGAKFPPERRMGHRICLAARKHGLLTRPVRDTLVLMPPLCLSEDELAVAVEALDRGIQEETGD